MSRKTKDDAKKTVATAPEKEIPGEPVASAAPLAADGAGTGPDAGPGPDFVATPPEADAANPDGAGGDNLGQTLSAVLEVDDPRSAAGDIRLVPQALDPQAEVREVPDDRQSRSATEHFFGSHVAHADKARVAACASRFFAMMAQGFAVPMIVDEGAAEFHRAAEFTLANRDAPAAAIAIDLARHGLGGAMKPDAAETAGWEVFKTVFLLVHDLLAAPDPAGAPAAAGDWPGDRALTVEPGAFDPVGLSAR